MDARGGEKVQGKVSAVASLLMLRSQPQDAQRQDFADLAQALPGAHAAAFDCALRALPAAGDFDDLAGASSTPLRLGRRHPLSGRSP